MKRSLITLVFSLGLLTCSMQTKAQIAIAEVIKAGVKKAIRAIDLKVQRLQNETIWLQNAQKTIENAMSKLKLEEISGWTQRQRDLYGDYFEELRKVKSLISYYHRIRDIAARQVQMVKAYQQAWHLLRQDQHFSPEEIDYMARVYGGMLKASLNNIDQLMIITGSFQTQMSDAQRLEMIRKAAEEIDGHYYQLKQFSSQNMQLSLSRSKDLTDANRIKTLYGLP